MPIQISEINQLLETVDNEECYKTAITHIPQLSSEELHLIIPSVYYLIWSTPVFKNQVKLIDFLMSNTPAQFHNFLFQFLVLKFSEISTDRKDKFFYFFKKFLFSENSFFKFVDFLSIENEEIFIFLLSQIKTKKIFNDWSDVLFVNFVGKSKAFLIEKIDENIKIDQAIIRKELESVKNTKNRDILIKLIQ
jgi:hypothetical protein